MGSPPVTMVSWCANRLTLHTVLKLWGLPKIMKKIHGNWLKNPPRKVNVELKDQEIIHGVVSKRLQSVKKRRSMFLFENNTVTS